MTSTVRCENCNEIVIPTCEDITVCKTCGTIYKHKYEGEDV